MRFPTTSTLWLSLLTAMICLLNTASFGQSSRNPSVSTRSSIPGGKIATFGGEGTVPFLSMSSGSCSTFVCEASKGHCSCSEWQGMKGISVTKLGQSKTQTIAKITTNDDDCPSGCCLIDGTIQFQRGSDILSLTVAGQSCSGAMSGTYQMIQGSGKFSSTEGVGNFQGTVNSTDGSLRISVLGIAQFL